MNNPDFWRAQWTDLPSELTSVDAENQPREKRGFATVITWPLVLLLLQAGIYAPLFGSGFLNSPFAGDAGAELAPFANAPEIAVEEEPEEEAPTPTSTPPVTPAPTLPPVVPTPGESASPVPTPTPTTEVPSPPLEVVNLDLTRGENTASLGRVKVYPGEFHSVAVRATNVGNVTLGNLTMKARGSNPLFNDATQGLRVHTWACSGAWSGTKAKPICSGAIVSGGSFTLAQGAKDMPYAVIAPKDTQNILFTLQLPSSADNRYQNQDTVVTATVMAEQTGGVVQ